MTGSVETPESFDVRLRAVVALAFLFTLGANSVVANETSGPEVWFDGVLIPLSVADPAQSTCTLENEMRKAECKGGKCETIRF